jgi:phospholipid/cholesterol/gamma-HCH transport system substrate-binding protein
MRSGLVRLQLVAFAGIALLLLAITIPTHTRIDDRLLNRLYTVTANFADADGIFEQALVTYNGVTVGKVSELRFVPAGVQVRMELEKKYRIPADTLAVIANQSALGQQYVDLRPKSPGGPLLRDGSQIPRENTQIPLEVTTVLSSASKLISAIDAKALATVLDETGKAFAGTGPALALTLDSGDRLVQQASERIDRTIALIQDSNTLLTTLVDQDPAIRSTVRNLALITDQLRQSDPDLRRVLRITPAALHEARDLLDRIGPTLPVLLGNLVTVSEIVVANLPGVRQTLITLPVVLSDLLTIAPGDGTFHVGNTLNLEDPPPCERGYEGTVKRPPDSVAPIPANLNAFCAEPPGSPINVRGSQNAAPPVNGLGPAANQVSVTPNTRSSLAQSAGSASAVPLSTFITSYNPATGATVGPDGRRVVIGTTGGQQRHLGKDSWQWLLVGPLAA